MVKHVIIWTLKDELSDEEKIQVKKNIKSGLEGLSGKIPGMTDIKVYIDGLSSSNTDLMLDTKMRLRLRVMPYIRRMWKWRTPPSVPIRRSDPASISRLDPFYAGKQNR